MGGSGGGGGVFTSRSNPVQLRQGAVDESERARFATEVNGLLARVLAEVNDRDVNKVADRLEEIREGLAGQGVGVESLFFGGSVAKHTYVDGLSDVDSLVLLDLDSLSGASPAEIRSQLAAAIKGTLDASEVETISVGNLAVSIRYRDGTVLQLLPAVRRGDQFAIASEDGRGWRLTDPKAFAERLTQSNSRLGGALVPAIKLAKAIIGELPEPQRLSGYHVEALAINAFRGYDGPRNPAAMLHHFFEFAKSAVYRPISDATGQSAHVDDYLGEEHSSSRQRIGASLARIARTIDSATLIGQWQELLGS